MKMAVFLGSLAQLSIVKYTVHCGTDSVLFIFSFQAYYLEKYQCA